MSKQQTVIKMYASDARKRKLLTKLKKKAKATGLSNSAMANYIFLLSLETDLEKKGRVKVEDYEKFTARVDDKHYKKAKQRATKYGHSVTDLFWETLERLK